MKFTTPVLENELRLNSWICQSGKNYQILTPEDLSLAIQECGYLEPILITSELLEKSGFTDQKGIGWCMEIPSLNKYLSVPLDEYCEVRLVMRYRNGVMTIATGINYLHKLQNLYFSLTGEELKVNL